MLRLKDRNKQIPNGLIFYVPQTKWKARRGQSILQIANQLIAHRKANPHLMAKFKWSIDLNEVMDEIDTFNAQVCKRMGWTEYIVDTAAGGRLSAFPFPKLPKVVSDLRAVAAGGLALVEWIRSKEEAVSTEKSERRALVCSTCKQNGAGPWTSYFTVPVSNEVKKALQQRRDWNLSTTHDEKINVCEVCYCPLRLKVHVPTKFIKEHIPKDVLVQLPPHCWMLSDLANEA